MKLPRKTVLSLMLSVTFGLSSSATYANLNSQLDSMFNNMSNTTAPGAYETARRGVLTGGAFTTRNKIMTTSLVSIKPPSFESGCGGIDMFGGSFSFINAQQFVQLLRSVASNAVGIASGYAFNMALDALCPTCQKHIETLQKKVQQLNQLFSNSCQLAQGLVTDAFSAIDSKRESASSTKSVSKGLSDVFGSWGDSTKSTSSKNYEAGVFEMCKDQGNVLWCLMQEKNTKGIYTYGDTQTQELIMSIVGSINLGAPDQNASDGKGKVPTISYIQPTGLSLKDFLEGTGDGTAPVYKCDDDDYCTKPSMKEIKIEGLAQKIEKAFSGVGGSIGIIGKFYHNTGSFSDDEKRMIGSLNGTPFGTMIRNLASRSDSLARTYVRTNSRVIALAMSQYFMDELLRGADMAIAGATIPHTEEAVRKLGEARKKFDSEIISLRMQFGGEPQLISQYREFMAAMPKTSLFIGRAANYPEASN